LTDFKPTPEQDAITQMARESTENFAVIARAGAAKTSTLVLIAEALPETDILCLAFNKAIATEMTERLPTNCEAKTLHGLGFKAWQQFTRKRMQVNSGKCYKMLKTRIDLLEGDDKAEAYDTLTETLQIIASGKQEGYLPDKFIGHWKPLIGDADFFAGLPLEPTGLQIALVQDVSAESFRQALDGFVDFDDMILCPALCSVSWPRPTLTLIDEAQDLAPINHHILKKLVKNRRIIAVGDPLQAIYGFRGALTDSMDQLKAKFSMHTLYLTVSFRCAKKITENAHWLAPDMRSPEWAPEGEVLRPVTWEPSQISEGDAIICRNNAPIFSMAMRLLEFDMLPEIAGKDLAAPLIKIMEKLGGKATPQIAALDAIDTWEQAQLKRAREGAKGGIRDRAECIRIMLRKTATIGDAIIYLKHLLQRDGRIHLMTIHKSKGLEYENVFFLDQHLCRIEKDQDANLKYVCETRAKKQLTYITTEGMVE